MAPRDLSFEYRLRPGDSGPLMNMNAHLGQGEADKAGEDNY